MNPFDAAVYFVTIVAIIMGFHAGLLRSLAAIFGYLTAMPLALAAAPPLSQILTDQFHLPQAQPWAVLCGIFLLAGMVLSALLRMAVSALVGPPRQHPGSPGRSAAGGGSHRPVGGGAGADLRPHHSSGARAGFPERLAAAAAADAGGTAGLEVAAAGGRGVHRPLEARAGDLRDPVQPSIVVIR